MKPDDGWTKERSQTCGYTIFSFLILHERSTGKNEEGNQAITWTNLQKPSSHPFNSNKNIFRANREIWLYNIAFFYVLWRLFEIFHSTIIVKSTINAFYVFMLFLNVSGKFFIFYISVFFFFLLFYKYFFYYFFYSPNPVQQEKM